MTDADLDMMGDGPMDTLADVAKRAEQPQDAVTVSKSDLIVLLEVQRHLNEATLELESALDELDLSDEAFREVLERLNKAAETQDEPDGQALLNEAQQTLDVLAEDVEDAGYPARAEAATELAMRIRAAIHEMKKTKAKE